MLWASVLRPEAERERERVFSPLAPGRFALGLETIYEGYLVHYGRPRLFTPPDDDVSLLLGDYLYAHGLMRIAELGDVAAVGDLAALISLCAQLRGDGVEGDGLAWAASAALLGCRDDGLADALAVLREGGGAERLALVARAAAGDGPVTLALTAHTRRVR